MSDLLDFSPPGQVTFSLSGAKARFFDAGTTNPRAVFFDQAQTIPVPVPLLADSDGLFDQVFVAGGAVKVVVTQADDSTGYTLDPCVKVAATGSAANAVSFTPSVLRPFTNVQDAIDLGTFPPRTITGSGIVNVTNGDGQAGNPTISVAPITTSEIAAATLVTASETIASNNNDTTIPTSAAVDAHIPAKLNAGGSAPIYACRAWINFNGSGTIAPRASGNVSSLIRNGTGDYTVNFVTAMPDANYAVFVTAGRGASASAGRIGLAPHGAALTASAVRFVVTDVAGVPQDSDFVSIAIFR